MEFQSSEDSVASAFITEELSRQLIGRPPATGAWRDGDPSGDRQFAPITNLKLARNRTSLKVTPNRGLVERHHRPGLGYRHRQVVGTLTKHVGRLSGFDRTGFAG